MSLSVSNSTQSPIYTSMPSNSNLSNADEQLKTIVADKDTKKLKSFMSHNPIISDHARGEAIIVFAEVARGMDALKLLLTKDTTISEEHRLQAITKAVRSGSIPRLNYLLEVDAESPLRRYNNEQALGQVVENICQMPPTGGRSCAGLKILLQQGISLASTKEAIKILVTQIPTKKSRLNELEMLFNALPEENRASFLKMARDLNNEPAVQLLERITLESLAQATQDLPGSQAVGMKNEPEVFLSKSTLLSERISMESSNPAQPLENPTIVLSHPNRTNQIEHNISTIDLPLRSQTEKSSHDSSSVSFVAIQPPLENFKGHEEIINPELQKSLELSTEETIQCLNETQKQQKIFHVSSALQEIVPHKQTISSNVDAVKMDDVVSDEHQMERTLQTTEKDALKPAEKTVLSVTTVTPSQTSTEPPKAQESTPEQAGQQLAKSTQKVLEKETETFAVLPAEPSHTDELNAVAINNNDFPSDDDLNPQNATSIIADVFYQSIGKNLPVFKSDDELTSMSDEKINLESTETHPLKPDERTALKTTTITPSQTSIVPQTIPESAPEQATGQQLAHLAQEALSQVPQAHAVLDTAPPGTEQLILAARANDVDAVREQLNNVAIHHNPNICEAALWLTSSLEIAYLLTSAAELGYLGMFRGIGIALYNKIRWLFT